MNGSALRHKQLFGGVFGRSGRYSLATVPKVERGLHAVRHLVIEPSTGAVLSIASGKREALAIAREVLEASEELARERLRSAGVHTVQASLWPEAPPSPFDMPPSGKRRPVSRRRREVFAKSDGRCHYCTAVLSLDGRWHVEHMLPRALGGEDEPSNLVAACVPCNLAKRDRTALEFVIADQPRDTI